MRRSRSVHAFQTSSRGAVNSRAFSAIPFCEASCSETPCSAAWLLLCLGAGGGAASQTGDLRNDVLRLVIEAANTKERQNLISKTPDTG